MEEASPEQTTKNVLSQLLSDCKPESNTFRVIKSQILPSRWWTYLVTEHPRPNAWATLCRTSIVASIGTELRAGFDSLLICSCRFTVLIK
jgi:hypothetical protein